MIGEPDKGTKAGVEMYALGTTQTLPTMVSHPTLEFFVARKTYLCILHVRGLTTKRASNTQTRGVNGYCHHQHILGD